MKSMASGEPRPELVREQLQHVLASPGFVRNERMSRFLRFVVEGQLEGRERELKESLIGVEVFGRRPGFDPQHDSTVRSEAARLRARIAEYYAGEGSRDALVIELPKGGYTPRFRQRSQDGETASPASDDEPKPSSRHPWPSIALAALAIAIVAGGLWNISRPTTPIPVAVLPLTNVSPDADSDYFADGLTGEIIRNLSIIEGLEVRSQTSSFAFKGKPRNVREAGKQLNVSYLLEGSVLRSGRQLRINVQLIRVRDDFAMWSAKFDRELTDIFAIQDEVSRGIVNNLRLKLGQGRRRYETSVEAYDLYLRARALNLQGSSPGDDRVLALLGDAIAKDSSFAPAYASIAAGHAARAGSFRLAVDDELSKMRAAAEKAIQLDPLLAEAHDALGVVHTRDGQWEQSERSFRRAIELDPGRSASYRHFASILLLPLGRIQESLQHLRTAEKADPLSPAVRYYLIYVLISAGRFDEAAALCEKPPADFQDQPLLLGRARLGQGRTNEAIHIFKEAMNRGVKPGSEVQGELGYAYARAGRREDAEKLAVSIPWQNPFNLALIYAGLGDKDRTFEALDRAAARGPGRVGRALTFPEFALLRGDPRVKELRKKVGLPE